MAIKVLLIHIWLTTDGILQTRNAQEIFQSSQSCHKIVCLFVSFFLAIELKSVFESWSWYQINTWSRIKYRHHNNLAGCIYNFQVLFKIISPFVQLPVQQTLALIKLIVKNMAIRQVYVQHTKSGLKIIVEDSVVIVRVSNKDGS